MCIVEVTLLNFYAKAIKQKSIDSRFIVDVGDITQLKTEKGIEVDCVVNTPNSTLSDKGGGINVAIHKAAGPELIQLTKKLHGSKPIVGRVYPVTLSKNNPLFLGQGVKHVRK